MLSIHILFINYFSVLKFRTLVLRDVFINITYKTLLHAKSHKTPKEIRHSKKIQMQGARILGRAQQIGFLFFFFVLLRDLRCCNEAQRSRWTFYEVFTFVIQKNQQAFRFTGFFV